MPKSKVIANRKSCLMTFEIREVEGSRLPRGMACDLRVPGGRHPPFLRELSIKGRPHEQGVSGERSEGETGVGLQIADLGSEEDVRADLARERRRDPEVGFVLPCSGGAQARGLRVVQEIECRIDSARSPVENRCVPCRWKGPMLSPRGTSAKLDHRLRARFNFRAKQKSPLRHLIHSNVRPMTLGNMRVSNELTDAG
jgi:hypothetical protein